MAAPGEAIAAVSTNDMPFSRNQLALLKIVNAGADFFDHADELVADHHRDRDRFLGPRVPVVNMNVGAADRSFLDPDQDVVRPDLRHRHFFQTESRRALAFHQRWHRFAHGVQIS